MASEVRIAGAGLNEAPGDVAWLNPGRITANDNSDAGGERVDSETTQRLRSTTHGFTIPSDATIDGFIVTDEIIDPDDTAITDLEAKLNKAGVPVGADRLLTPIWGARLTRTHGGASDLWGTTWTPAEVNASGFGFSLRAIATGDRGEPAVDHFTIECFFTPAAGDGARMYLVD